MSKTLRGPSAPKVEVDQRSREARLRLEQVEGLLVPWVPPTRSWLRRGLHRLSSMRGPRATEELARAELKDSS